MYEAHFQRVEEKYMLTRSMKEEFLKRVSNYIEKDKYYLSNIYNIYFDTENSDLIVNSINKPLFKDKFRIRSYGVPTLDDDVFLEIKVKYNGVVGKRREKMKLRDFYSFVESDTDSIDNQILKEFNYYYKHYDLKPAVYIAYDRESYRGIEDNELRITLDNNLRSRRDHLNLDEDGENKQFFDDEIFLMEIKTLRALPLWLTRILSDMNIMPMSFSKYGKIYEREKVGRDVYLKQIAN